VMTVRDQHDIYLRESIEGDAGIVAAFWSGKGKGPGPLVPVGIDENVETRGLDRPTRVADEREPRLVAVDPRGRGVGIGTGRPFRPDRALAVAAKLPAQHFAELLGRHAIGIEENPAVEMVGRRLVAGTVHGERLAAKRPACARGKPRFRLHETASVPIPKFV